MPCSIDPTSSKSGFKLGGSSLLPSDASASTKSISTTHKLFWSSADKLLEQLISTCTETDNFILVVDSEY
jgi:hypothetical protein